MDVSVVVPVFNSEQTLDSLVTRLEAVLADAAEAFELVLVDDGSADGSWARIEKLAADHPHVTGVRLRRNFGEHNAVLCGIRRARHPVVVTLDDDLQHPPEEIPALLGALDDGADLVYGVPEAMAQSRGRVAAAFVWKRVIERALGVAGARHLSTFRAFRTDLRDAFSGYHGPAASVDVLLGWGTARVEAVPVRHDPRTVGTSGYTLPKLVDHTTDLITGYSVAPLRLASIGGIGLLALAVVLTAVAAAEQLLGDGSATAAWLLAAALPALAGVQLLAIGLLGEYVARMHLRLISAPGYVVADTTEPLR